MEFVVQGPSKSGIAFLPALRLQSWPEPEAFLKFEKHSVCVGERLIPTNQNCPQIEKQGPRVVSSSPYPTGRKLHHPHRGRQPLLMDYSPEPFSVLQLQLQTSSFLLG